MSGFIFQWPAMLAVLVLTIPLVLLLSHARRQRLRVIDAMGGGLTTHRRLRDVLRVLAFVLMILALARPGHSPRMESSSRTGRDVVFALDVSRSMLAEDVTPSRLEVAKQAIRDALDTFGNERVGLVVYAGSASILCPLTYDYDFVRYMLEQAHPRSVDFGGTTLQSAVEKVIDQVFLDDRGGVQDLVVLTDGGDHGSKATKVIELLEENQVDVLMIGLGDPQRGSPIRIEDPEGNPQLLEADGEVVTTKLDDAAIRSLVAQTPRAEYVAAGTSPFYLGELYRDYALDKQTETADSESNVIIYQNAAGFFLLPAVLLLLLSECWGARGLQLGTAALWLIGMAQAPPLDAADEFFRLGFDAAVTEFKAGNYEEAVQSFSTLHLEATENSASASDLATVQLNRGLALLKLSEAQVEQNPVIALSYARDAQIAFLAAKRYVPQLTRAGVRLELTAKYVAELQAAADSEDEANEALNDAMEALVERLQRLLESQQKLREWTVSNDVNRNQGRRNKNQSPPPLVVPPENAAQSSKEFISQQAGLHMEGLGIHEVMLEIDQQLKMPSESSLPEFDTLMTEPLRLIEDVLTAQLKASELFVQWASWPAARGEQQLAERGIEKILELLSSNSQEQSQDTDEWEDYEDEYDYDYMDESEESTNISESMQGDFAAGSEIQELPVPNYSVDDILMEEQGNLQFRQQKRASANAAKVDKDY